MKKITALFMSILIVVTAFLTAIPATAWYQYTPETCKHLTADPNNEYKNPAYYFSQNNSCFMCGYVCEHPEDQRVYYCDSSCEITAETHSFKYKCNYCWNDGIQSINATEEHQFSNWEPASNGKHFRKCNVCNYEEYSSCSYKTTYKKASNDKTHKVTKTCKVCKNVTTSNQKHTYKDNKCTKCGYKKVVPGALKITTAKNTVKGKKRVINVAGKWVTVNGKRVWKKAYSYNVYDYKISFKVSSKNAVKYIVNTKADIDADDGRDNKKTYSKNQFTYTYTSAKNKKPSKVTLYITPVSKTGTYGKTVIKTISLKN